ncbi:hypothetical protein JCM3765_001991 [Sporobolomyces pararoseus]
MSTTSYDLSPLYRHSTSLLIPLKPLLVSIHSSKLILRSSTTLQIIRTWSLPVPPTLGGGGGDYSITLSPPTTLKDYVLISHSKLDKVLIIDLDESEPIGNIKISKIEGFQTKLVWDSINLDRILIWADNRLRINLLSLKNPQSVYQIQSPKSTTTAISYSFSEKYFALLERHENRDCIGIYDPLSNWSLLRNIVISDPTSDLIGLKFSPNGGKYFVTWSSITHYYLHIFTPDGRLIKTFKPYSSFTTTTTTTSSTSNSNVSTPGGNSKPRSNAKKTAPSTSSSLQTESPLNGSSKEQIRIDKENSSYVGLGIKVVEWSPNGEFLAIGGYDGKIRVLSKLMNWNVVVELTSPNKISTNSSTIVWREPSIGWVEKTLGKGIITFDQIETSNRTPYLVQNDSTIQSTTIWDNNNNSSSNLQQQPFPKMGWSKLVWSESGNWLVGYNQSYPNHLYIFKFMRYTNTTAAARDDEKISSHRRRRCPHVSPRLHNLILLNSPPKNFKFKTNPTTTTTEEEEEETLFILSGSNSFIVWNSKTTFSEEEEEEEKVSIQIEGVGIPTPESNNFNPNILELSTSSTSGEEEEEEEVILLGEKSGMFCLVYPVKESAIDRIESGDRTWIEGEDY